MNNVNFYDAVMIRASSLDSLFSGKPTPYRKLLWFMEINGWFQIEHSGEWKQIFVSEFPDVFPQMDIWLSAYGRRLYEQCDVLNTHFSNCYPHTCDAFTRFTGMNKQASDRDRLILMDYLLSVLDTDAASWTDPAICRILSGGTDCLPKRTFSILAGFCTFMSESNRKYISTQQTVARPTNAFPLKNYAGMAWIALDEEQIRKGDYLAKAAADARAAEIWLFVALHFVCAVRVPDLRTLPVPALTESGPVMREKILDGTFDTNAATELASTWLYRFEMESHVPLKTRRYSGISSVTVSIPTSYLVVFGKILALAASFCEEGEPLISKGFVTSTQMNAFFGPAFSALCGNELFMSTRKFNKSYLQGVSAVADSCGAYHISGYLAAALLRSHKIPYAGLPESTDDYLRDGAFLGLTPEVVAAEMFERGCFSFIPVLLLSSCFPDDWKLLDIHTQTEVLNELALTPAQLDHVTGAVLAMKQHVYENLAEIFRDGFSREKLLEMLKRVSDGLAPGKDNGCHCLRSAAGLPCTDPQRATCIGCGCEIWTRTGIHLLLGSYEFNMKQIQTAEPIDAMRLKAINEQIIIPSLTGILENLSTLYADNEVAESLSVMIKRRISNAGSSAV